MAEKIKRGLPQGFSIAPDDVPTVIGDYLDEEDRISQTVISARNESAKRAAGGEAKKPALTQGALSVAPAAPKETPKEMPPSATPSETIREEARSATSFTSAPFAREVEEKVKPPSIRASWKRPRRTQINLSADSEHKLEELLKHFSAFGPEADIKKSEIFEALVILAHEARERLDLNKIPRRGAWGSQTEKNFSASIAEAFSEALALQEEVWAKVQNE